MPEEQVERVNLASLIYEKRGDNETAIRYLTEIVRSWQEKPELVTESAVRLAKLWNKIENPQKGIELLDRFLKEKLSDFDVRKVHKAKSEIALEAKLTDAAISSLSFLVSADEKAAEEKFRLGDLYFQKGEIKKSRKCMVKYS